MDMVLNKTGNVCKYKRNMGVRSCNHRCCGNVIAITYPEYVFVYLVIQQAKGMRRIAFSSVACLILPYFPTTSHKRHDFRKSLLNKSLCFDFLYGFYLKYVSF